MSSDGYSFRLLGLDEEELERTSSLLRLVFPKANYLTADYLRWQYVDNPDGRAVGCNAFLNDELVGHMTAVPMQGRLAGEARPGLFMLNGAVHPGHRRRKLQSRISAAIFEEASSRGYEYCFGTGNRYSTGPLLTRFKLLKPLEARIGFGLPRRKTAGPKPSFERIWSDAAMRWRLANPHRAYAVRSNGQGSAVMSESGVPGVTALLYEGRRQWPDASGQGARAPLRLWLGLDPEVDWKRSSYAPIPSRLRPSPLNLVFKDLTGGSFLPNPDKVVFRAIDFDPY